MDVCIQYIPKATPLTKDKDEGLKRRLTLTNSKPAENASGVSKGAKAGSTVDTKRAADPSKAKKPTFFFYI